MGKKKDGHGLGKAMIRDRFGGKKAQKSKDSFLHTTELDDGYDWGRLNLQSVTEQSNLDEFLTTADLAGTEFTAEKLNIQFVNPEVGSGLLSAEEEKEVKAKHEQHKELLRIPRRPVWDESTTPDELDRRERESFLEWRRSLAELQEVQGLLMTPFERNLDFWRQLWRVIERSDVVVQIVDARNPLLFRCEDLEAYVHEVDKSKINMVLINKADLLTQEQREIWRDYFNKIGLKVAFWSAVKETEKLKAQEETIPEEDSDEENDDSEENEDEEEDEDIEDNQATVGEHPKMDRDSNSESTTETARLSEAIEKTTERLGEVVNVGDSNIHVRNSEKGAHCSCGQDDSCLLNNNADLLSGEQLIELFRSLHTGKKVTEGVTTIGLVGYPNVGKSSTINAILRTKKVPVSATPGRTKHFQTLYVDKSLLLCDCPGLVMPTFVATKAEMVVSGILPIDQMRDHVPPISYVCSRIPRATLETIYGISLPTPMEGDDPSRPPTAHELLSAYGYMRGFMTHKGLPDQPRSARCILKDYVNGKLLFCTPPPDVSKETFGSEATVILKAPRPKKEVVTGKKTAGGQKIKMTFANPVDQQFFEGHESKVGMKGKQGPPGSQSVGSSTQSLKEKPWKHHGNRKKKQKLRRIHGYMDA